MVYACGHMCGQRPAARSQFSSLTLCEGPRCRTWGFRLAARLFIHPPHQITRAASFFLYSFLLFLFIFFETEYLHGDLCPFPHLTPADISEGICCLPCLGSLLLVKPTTLPGAPPGMALRAKATTLPEASRWGSFWFPGTRQRWLSS